MQPHFQMTPTFHLCSRDTELTLLQLCKHVMLSLPSHCCELISLSETAFLLVHLVNSCSFLKFQLCEAFLEFLGRLRIYLPCASAVLYNASNKAISSIYFNIFFHACLLTNCKFLEGRGWIILSLRCPALCLVHRGV